MRWATPGTFRTIVVGLGIPTQRIGPADVKRLGPVVARAGLEASRALGYDSSQAIG